MDFDDEDDGGGGGDGGDDITQYDVNMMMSESQQSGNLAKAPYTKQQVIRSFPVVMVVYNPIQQIQL